MATEYMRVHLLATVRQPDLLPAATLVFKTLRVGFPTVDVTVWVNGPDHYTEIFRAGEKVGIKAFVELTTVHHKWVTYLIEHEQEPFWICDTDVVFFGNMEHFDFGNARLAGRYSPKFNCKFSRAFTMPRLHTCLMRIEPEPLRAAVALYGGLFPDCYATPRPTLEDLVFPRYIPDVEHTRPSFYDTCGLLYHALGGIKMQPKHMDCFEHLGSATLSDLVAKAYPEYRVRETHFSIFENPQLAKGLGKMQDRFYAEHAY